MSSIKMVALRKHPFGTGERDAGEEYEATPDESAILIALGWGKKAPEKAAEKAPDAPAAIDNKALDAEASENKRTYKRRDLKAKD